MKSKVADKTVMVSVDELNGATYNPRKITPYQLRSLKKSIEKYGILEPLIVNKTTGNTVVGGHQRLRIAKELGIKEVPVQFIEMSDPDEEKSLNLALNKVGGEFDRPKLVSLFQSMDLKALDLQMTGFSRDEVNKMLMQKEEDVEPEYPITPYFSEKYNYVVIMTKDEVEFTYLKNALQLTTEQSYKSSATGIGKVVSFEKFSKLWEERSSK